MVDWVAVYDTAMGQITIRRLRERTEVGQRSLAPGKEDVKHRQKCNEQFCMCEMQSESRVVIE